MIIGTAFLLTGLMAATPVLDNAMPVHIVGPWTIEVGPGVVKGINGQVELTKSEIFKIPAPVPVTIKEEAYPHLRVFNPKTGGWTRGERLKALIAQECTATGALVPASVVVKSADRSVVYERGKDYELDDSWATLGRLEGGRIGADTAVLVDYTYFPEQLHAVLYGDGGTRLASGKPGLAVIHPPMHKRGEKALVTVWTHGNMDKLTEENIFPLSPSMKKMLPDDPEEDALRHFPKTLAKLRAGEKVRIVAWGDSVTVGGGVLPDKSKRYQDQFLAMLMERFPRAEIEMITAGWGGSSSAQWLKQPEGAEHNFQRDVLDPKPDLVTIEFVNDAYLTEDQTVEHYKMLLDRIRGAGAELIVLTPHLVRPDWMGVDSVKFDDDPRPYVKGLRRFAREYDVALADASVEWCKLWRIGIPYPTLLGNAINHPDERGHRIFAKALLKLFPTW